MPAFTLSTIWWKCAAPKNKGHINMAVIGVKHCNSNGNMHALNAHSSANGATTRFLHHIIVFTLRSQYIGSGKDNIIIWQRLNCTYICMQSLNTTDRYIISKVRWNLVRIMALDIVSLLIIMASQLLELNRAIVDPITPKSLPKSYKLQYRIYNYTSK